MEWKSKQKQIIESERLVLRPYEPVDAKVAYGFEVLGFNRICGGCLKRNPASVCVLQKAGFQYEGCLRQYREKNGVLEDFQVFSILRSEYRN